MIKCIILLLSINFSVTSLHIHKRNVGFVDHTDPSHEHIRRKPDDRSATIKKVKGLYVCDKEKICESITEFDIAKNESFSCNDRNLAIQFQTTDTQNGSKKSTISGFLKKDKPIIANSQQTSKVCYHIKRYCLFILIGAFHYNHFLKSFYRVKIGKIFEFIDFRNFFFKNLGIHSFIILLITAKL